MNSAPNYNVVDMKIAQPTIQKFACWTSEQQLRVKGNVFQELTIHKHHFSHSKTKQNTKISDVLLGLKYKLLTFTVF